VNDPTRLRELRDMVSLSAWKVLLDEIKTMESREIMTLVSNAKSSTVEQLKFQAGVIDGIQRVVLLLANTEKRARRE
jgi:hypothetical protein